VLPHVSQYDEQAEGFLAMTRPLNILRDLTYSVGQAARSGTESSEGEIFAGNSQKLSFSDPAVDSRTPNIIVAPDVGAVYTGGTSKVSEHGGFAYD
jgi:hypothetical protein